MGYGTRMPKEFIQPRTKRPNKCVVCLKALRINYGKTELCSQHYEMEYRLNRRYQNV